MDVRQLKALVTVVEVGSVTRAAELLHLVQPAVTRQIRSLEHELGVPLFERTRQGLHTLITTGARQAGTEINAVVHTNSMILQKQLVRGRHGWTILPAVGIAGDLAGGTLSAAPLCEPEIWRSIVLGMPRTGQVPASVEVVARELVTQVESLVHGGQWPSARLDDRAGPT